MVVSLKLEMCSEHSGASVHLLVAHSMLYTVNYFQNKEFKSNQNQVRVVFLYSWFQVSVGLNFKFK